MRDDTPRSRNIDGPLIPSRDLRVACPFCHSRDVELLSLFGSQLLTDQYYCRACRTPFEHLHADAEDAAHEYR
jgi:ring-1,2-phenylacetyl-CoA epoxidase subunit PaaD